MPTTTPSTVQSPLNLLLTIKPGQVASVQQALAQNQAKLNEALTTVGTVHFARFLFVPNTQLLFVLTEYDGDFSTYIEAFVQRLGPIFDALLSFMDPAPPLPVSKYPKEFEAFIRKYNVGTGFYSAYPQCTVMQIWGKGCAKP